MNETFFKFKCPLIKRLFNQPPSKFLWTLSRLANSTTVLTPNINISYDVIVILLNLHSNLIISNTLSFSAEVDVRFQRATTTTVAAAAAVTAMATVATAATPATPATPPPPSSSSAAAACAHCHY